MEYQDLKIIKKKYGEQMAHLCRNLFPTILENEGELPKLMLDNFEPSKFLCEDIIRNNLVDNFKNYVYSKYIKEQEAKEVSIEETPEQLMDKAGYILKECHTEEEMQVYKKYYKEDEVICTLERIGRLKKCRVFFAVKKNVDEIKRENFKQPRRQDEYGTSVISIQFSKDAAHYLSIKNRYNHTVEDCDATFSNDLDNIIAGLTDSFAYYYGLKQRVKQGDFELLGYTQDVEGKYYKYNYEINNVYYCPNNIIISNGIAKKFDKEKYIVMDYFVLDLVNKKIIDYAYTGDSFLEGLSNIEKIEVINDNENKIITIYQENQKPVIIKLDKYNRIIGYFNDNLSEIKSYFLYENKVLEEVSFSNIKKIGDCSLAYKPISDICLPETLVEIGFHAFANSKLKKVSIPSSVKVIKDFAFYKSKLENVEFLGDKIILGTGAFCGNKIKKVKISKPYTKDMIIGFDSNVKMIQPNKFQEMLKNIFKSNEEENEKGKCR